ncbi:MAG: tetratricopeptide repeat protein [Flavobacteriales bacterium]|nr:tetratricopeptide repeat protein [Flavobacteriales bacterium]
MIKLIRDKVGSFEKLKAPLLKRRGWGRSLFLLVLFFSLSTDLLAQTDTDEQLAAQYFKNGEYEKAEVYYQKLYKRYNDEFFFQYYIDCLLKLENFKEAEKAVDKRIKRESEPVLYVHLGHVYKAAGDEAKAQQSFAKAIQELPPFQRQIEALANAFTDKGELDFVVKTYERGRKLLNGLYNYRFELASVYGKQGKFDLALEEYLDALMEDESQITKVKTDLLETFSDDQSGKKREYFEEAVVGRIQRQPQRDIYPELLIWYFEQDKKFAQAFAQAKALDRRNREDGSRIVQLAHICRANEAYDMAIEAYQYVIKKGKDNYYYLSCKKDLVNTLYEKAVAGGQYTEAELADLEKTFLTTLEEFGRNGNVAQMMMNLAELYTFYIHNTEKGIDMLYEVIELPGIGREDLANAKIQLADALLFTGEVWETTLLYSQAEKMFKTSDIGRMAKLKNAKLAYYTGQFDWAQAQLNVLKAATSDFIANDALYLAMLIQDNSYMDTTYSALGTFARADLLLYQNKLDSAKMALDSIEEFHPGHSLMDDILFKRGQIAERENDFEKAAEFYGRVQSEYPDDLLADDAIYRLAQLNEDKLGSTSKAMEYYQQLLLHYPGSLYTVEARKRYRALRGDLLN